MTEQLVKILIRTADGDDVHVETPWARQVAEHHFELANYPWFAYGVSYEDVVEARAEDDGLPELRRVVRKSGNRTIRVILSAPVPEDQRSTAFLDRLRELGCDYEGLNREYFAVNIPPEISLMDVCKFVTDAQQQWEHADPTYDELYPDG